MTITAQTSKTGPYNGNGTTTVFSYTFEVQDETHLVVTLADAAGVETVQVLNTDYTVSGVGNANGGQITMSTAPAPTYTLTISRNVPITQEVDLENRRSVAPEVLEDAYDKLTQIAQDLSEQLGRAIKISVTEGGNPTLTLEGDVQPGTFLGFDASGNLAQFAPASGTFISPSAAIVAVDDFTGDGTTVDFTLGGIPQSPNNLFIFLDGVMQDAANYTVSGTTLTFTTAPPLNTNIEVRRFQSIPLSPGATTADLVTYSPTGSGAVTRTVQSRLRDFVSVKDFGAVGDGVTDDTAAFNAMVAAANASSEPAVVLYVGGGSYYLPNGVTTPISRNNVTIKQYGATLTIDAGPLWTFGDRAGQYANGGVYGGFVSGAAGDNSTRIAKVQGYAGFHLVDVNPDRVAGLIVLGHDGTYRGQGAMVQNIRGSTLDIDGAVCIDCAFGGGLIASDIQISSVTAAGTVAPLVTNRTDLTTQRDTVGIRINGASSWDTMSMSDVIMGHYNVGLQAKPNTSVFHVNMKFTNCFWDYSGTYGLEMVPNGGVCHNFTFTSCWFVSIDEYAVYLAGSGAVRVVRFIGCEGRQSGKSNWRFSTSIVADTVELIGCYGVGANRLSTNTGSDQDDLVIGISGVSVQGGRFGQDGLPFTGISGNQARYGITLGSNLNNVMLESIMADGTTGGYQVPVYTSNGNAVNVRSNRRKDQPRPEYAIVAPLSPVPASGVSQTWYGPFDGEMNISGGTVSQISQKGSTVATGTDRNITLRPGDTWAVTYTVAPTITINRLS